MRPTLPPSDGSGILSIWNDIKPDDDSFYERWYMGQHFPERLGVPGFLRGRRYRAIKADRTYFTFYDLENPDVLFSEPYITRLNAPTIWTQSMMSNWGPMFRTVCQRVRRKGSAIGGFAAVARWENPVDLPLDLADRVLGALTDPRIVAVDHWRATSRQNEATVEASTRPTADRTITAALIAEATSEAGIEAAAAAIPRLVAPAAGPSVVGLYRLIALQDAGS